MSAPLRVALVGAGRMGAHHARILGSVDGARLACIHDKHTERAAELAQRHGCPMVADLEGVIAGCDAAIVATSSSAHRAVGRALLEAGIPCLIEKPLATSEAETVALIDSAQRSGATLLVGHVERFNPAVQQLASLLEGQRLDALDARRLSWSSARITDVDVVLDLMVHDLDIVLWLVGKPVARLAASAVQAPGRKGEDYVTALLSFAGGAMASLTASRVTQTKLRELHLTTSFGYVTVNLITQEVLVFRHGEAERGPYHWTNSGNAILDAVMERVLIRNAEPLMVELQHFVDAVRDGTPPLVTGAQALETLRIAERIRAGVARTHG